jgi:hypothetical protein
MAEQCLAELRELNQEMVTTGYGMAGPRGYGVGAPAGGWYGPVGPRREMDALFAAAEVLARNGKQEACQVVLEEMRSIYGERMEQIREAGIPPEEVRGWRHQRLLQAQPADEMERVLSIDNILGADVRNLRDEDLGDIEDVLLGDEGNIEYVLVSRGGFFGIGENLIPLRWQDLSFVPDLDTFVLDVPESVLEQAPTVNREVFADLQNYDQRREQIEDYWSQQAG